MLHATGVKDSKEVRRKKLTSKYIDTLKPEGRPYNVNDTEVKGFIIRVEPSGRMFFYARYRVNGRPTQMKIGDAATLMPEEARKKAKKIIGEAADGHDPLAKRKEQRTQTIGDLIEGDYDKLVLAHRKSGASIRARIETCFKEFWHRKLNDPTLLNAITNWRSKRLKGELSFIGNPEETREIQASTVNRDIAALKAAFAWAVEQGYTKIHPLAKLKPLKLDKQPAVRYLSAEEEMRLLAALDAREKEMREERVNYNKWREERHLPTLPDLREQPFTDYLKPMVLISLYTGMRRGEIFNLTWQDVDLDRGMLTVQGYGAKSGNTRHIPLNPHAAAILKDWRNVDDGAGLVFKGKTGGRFDNVSSSWQRLLDKGHAKINNFRWHDMRHHFASKLVMAGVDLNTVRDLLGHSDIKMTLRYAHLAPEVKAQAVARIVLGKSNVVPFPGTAQEGKA